MHAPPDRIENYGTYYAIMRNMETTPEERDGRVERTARSRAAIVGSLFELVGEGNLLPTAQEVAARAKVGIRTVFRHFSDMENLYVEIDARLRSEIQSRLRIVKPSGSLSERACQMIAQRAEMFEIISPYKHATDLLRWKSEFLATQHRRMVREQRANLFRWLPELESASDELKQALELLTSFAAWNRLRLDQRLSADRARATIEKSVSSLLGAVE